MPLQSAAGVILIVQQLVHERDRVNTLTPGDPACVDAFDRGHYLRGLALLLALGGEDRKAVQALRTMLQEPNQISRAYLARHPTLKKYVAEL
jgi:hypothetical protein